MTTGNRSLLSLNFALVLGLSLSGCFEGGDTAGAVCTSDSSCSNGLKCENGFCGGSPADASEESGAESNGEAETGVESGSESGDQGTETAGDGDGDRKSVV